MPFISIVKDYVKVSERDLARSEGKEVDRGVRPRFRSSGARLQLIGCTLYYVWPRDFERLRQEARYK
jgi:hypothetical protein